MPQEGFFPDSIQVSFNRYYPYLMEIRKRLLFIAAIFLVSGFLGFFYYEKIISFILSSLNFSGINIAFTSPFQFFTLALNSGLLAGLVFSFPLILWQILLFIKPALTKKEFKVLLISIPMTMVLFTIGFFYGVAIMKYVMAIFYQKSVELNISNLLDINLLLSKIILTGVFLGAAFQFPLILTIVMRLSVVHYKDVVKQRMLAYAVAIIFAALLPPTDLLSLLFLTLPLVFLFEITLLLNKAVLKSHLIEKRK